MIIGTDAALDLRAGTADIAIRYARRMPADLVAQEIFRDAFFSGMQARPVGAGCPADRASCAIH